MTYLIKTGTSPLSNEKVTVTPSGEQSQTAEIGRDSPKFMLRLPIGMREDLAAEARKNKRSMNAEIVDRLEATFLPPSDEFSLVIMREGLSAAQKSLEAKEQQLTQVLSRLAQLEEIWREHSK